MLHIPIEHADDVNKLFVIPRVVNVSLAILRLVQLLRLFRALQTSRVLNISTYALTHELIVKLYFSVI